VRAVLVPSFAAWLMWAGCGGAPPSPPAAASPPPVPHERAEPAPTAAPSAPAQALPPPGAPLRGPRGRGIVTDRDDPTMPILPLRPLEMPLERKSDSWSPCVRAFVQTQPAPARAVLGDALSLYSTSCSATRVEFQVPRQGRSAPASQLGLIGALERSTGELALRAAYHGAPIRAERITVISDGARWSSPRIAFDRDTGDEIAILPFTRTIAGVVRRVIDARDALLRFEGAAGYEDVAISDELKQELRTMLDALDTLAAIKQP
jgi:hypothetical protein